jgi:hypothetical protein
MIRMTRLSAQIADSTIKSADRWPDESGQFTFLHWAISGQKLTNTATGDLPIS